MSRRNPYRQDHHTRAARAAGYPARSVYKLEEIHRRLKLIALGQRVLDLGAAPGSWSRFAAEIVGGGGLVVAIDLQPIDAIAVLGRGAVVQRLEGDALAPNEELVAEAPFDVVLSDMAPRTSGNKLRDRYLSYELALGALQVARQLGREGSNFVAKIFMSEDFEDAKRQVSEAYDQVKVIRPEATRGASTEVFLVGARLKPEAMLPTPSAPDESSGSAPAGSSGASAPHVGTSRARSGGPSGSRATRSRG
ncbi:MAG: RlmE family RNA methyltransferase [Polyangiaceae bacterium]|nr:RlmE family RNA methyltransferase [Polyangiaceae bacterium]MCW5789852.1 RlmE family RNA methyltransferase [Polyangiaceae bacterium]